MHPSLTVLIRSHTCRSSLSTFISGTRKNGRFSSGTSRAFSAALRMIPDLPSFPCERGQQLEARRRCSCRPRLALCRFSAALTRLPQMRCSRSSSPPCSTCSAPDPGPKTVAAPYVSQVTVAERTILARLFTDLQERQTSKWSLARPAGLPVAPLPLSPLPGALGSSKENIVSRFSPHDMFNISLHSDSFHPG